MDEKFWTQVAKRPGGCWEWQGAQSTQGYGLLRRAGKTIGAHRYSLMLHLGRETLARHEYVCHRCHNRRCVNPGHLYLGDAVTNSDDTDRSGRRAKGAGLPQTKLTEDAVRLIRETGTTSDARRALAEQFGVSQSAVYCIHRRFSWRHVSD